jgi:hypothetical protein
MKIPETISIAGHQVKIVTKEKLESDGAACVGLAYTGQDLIHLARTCHGVKLNSAQRATAFLHESLHIISVLYGLNLTEKQVSQWEVILYQFLHDNRLRF